MISINLKAESIFKADSISFGPKLNFLYGRNGTGKSTLCKLMKEQLGDKDVRIFNGFDNIVGQDQQLNAVVLGEENNEIDAQIKALAKKISEKNKEIDLINKDILENEDCPNNLYSKHIEAQEALSKINKAISKFKSETAAAIKKATPQISSPTYDIRNITAEIPSANSLSDNELIKTKKMLLSTPKTAPDIDFPNFDCRSLLDSANGLLVKKVAEKVKIKRIEGDSNKQNFAQNGLAMHKAGDICAFCGNIITEECYEELESYFSADEVKRFQKEIKTFLSRIDSEITQLSAIKIDSSNFYPEYNEECNDLSITFESKKKTVLEFFAFIKEKVNGKLSNLFSEDEEIEFDCDGNFDDTQQKYNSIKELNNKNDLPARQEEARKALRLNWISSELEKFNYGDKMQELAAKSQVAEGFKEDIKSRRIEISKLEKKISDLKSDISELESSTLSIEKLATSINQKLKNLTYFQLISVGKGKEGYYLIKDIRTGETRNVTELSTGEQNIIAFLYFIEKINEHNDTLAQLDKVLVFDDPMNSNDDYMQYLIMEELLGLRKKMSDNDTLIVMTHNKHFYLNITYGLKPSKNKPFIHLMPDGEGTQIVYVEDKDNDFKTNYAALWAEMLFIYKCDKASPNMLLNPMRRIIETFTKFNNIKSNDFYRDNQVARKLFNVNSHSIDDLEAELNGNCKEEIVKIFKDCFINNNAKAHFDEYFTIDI